mgnify:CR=1 FL=1
MNKEEAYEFDRQGYIVIKDMLDAAQVQSLAAAIDALEEHALAHVALPPRKVSAWGAEYHASAEKGYHVQGAKAEGQTLIIEDFWNADPTFDVLVNHARTMEYIHAIVKSRPTINNSEIRIRYRGNASGSHGGSRAANQSAPSATQVADSMIRPMVKGRGSSRAPLRASRPVPPRASAGGRS